MSTTLPTFKDKQWISDFIKWEEDVRISRKVVTVAPNQTLLRGQIVSNSGAGINDVQAFTLAGTIASGTLKFQYGANQNLTTAALAGTGITAATVQTALRALGVLAGDVALAACTVALSVAAAGVDTAVYTVTCTTQAVPALQVVSNTCQTAGQVPCTLGSAGTVPGTTITGTLNVGAHTIGAAPNTVQKLASDATTGYGIMLVDVTTGSVPKQALAAVRHCVIDGDQVTFGDQITSSAAKQVILNAMENSALVVQYNEPDAGNTQIQYT